MTRLLPYPLMCAGLFVLWLLLTQSLAPGHILLGGLIAVAGGWALARVEVPVARVRRLAAILHLSGLVVADIVRSNIAVLRIILGVAGHQRRAGFVDIPLELRNPYGLAALACIITSTPGTLWVEFDGARGVLTIHVLDLIDDDAWRRTIKGRYEKLLLEIFA
jgi:multicomponent K+:H+ antiporter subunit E